MTYTFAGGLYEEIVEGTKTTQKAYVDGVILNTKVFNSGVDASNDTLYLHTDNLGSVETISDKLGAFVSRMSFSDWGERQQSDWKTGSPTGSFPTANGYTGHHQLDQHKLVHMGGRVYDPGLGRFLSADLFVQSPYSSQSFNRYSYVANNPLSNVDPTGYECDKITSNAGTVWETVRYTTDTCGGGGGGGGGHDSGVEAIGDANNIAKNITPQKLDLTQQEIIRRNAEGCANGTFSCHDAYNYLVDNGLSPYLDIGTVLKDFYKKAVEIALFGPSRAGASFVAPKAAGEVIKKTAGQLGKEGEAAVRAAHTIGDKKNIVVNGRDRTPDGMTATTLSEVKNVGHQSFTKQLRDYLDFAQDKGLRFDLYVRPNTTLSGPLEQARASGFINVIRTEM